VDESFHDPFYFKNKFLGMPKNISTQDRISLFGCQWKSEFSEKIVSQPYAAVNHNSLTKMG